jgi:zinc protease
LKLLYTVCALALFFGSNSYGFEKKITKVAWSDSLEVVFLEDHRFPTYALSIYFADGALGDHRGRLGETDAMFANLTAGTNRYNQKQISDALEFYGTSFSYNVTHEYSSVGIAGLAKDFRPNVKMLCHLFKDATFPKRELLTYKRKLVSAFESMASNHSALANRIFRELSLKNTLYQAPVSGKIKTIKRFTSKFLDKKLQYFKKKVKKRIYLVGPNKLDELKRVVSEECDFNIAGASFVRSVKDSNAKFAKSRKIYLIPVPNANQAQVRVGSYLGQSEIEEPDLMSVASGFLGGGYTSKLMTEIRHKRGLSYSVSTVATKQKQYGRAAISTFTKNPSIAQLMKVIKDSLNEMSSGKFSRLELRDSVNFLSGSYLFQFEKGSSYLANLLYFDHIGRNYDELYAFPEKIKRFKKPQVAEMIEKLFSWDKQTVVIVGSRNLLKDLRAFGSVQVVDYKKFL